MPGAVHSGCRSRRRRRLRVHQAVAWHRHISEITKLFFVFACPVYYSCISKIFLQPRALGRALGFTPAIERYTGHVHKSRNTAVVVNNKYDRTPALRAEQRDMLTDKKLHF